jgi:hypothetical protein
MQHFAYSLDKLGVPIDRLGDSTGEIQSLSGV